MLFEVFHKNKSFSVAFSTVLLLILRIENFFIDPRPAASSGIIFPLLRTETWPHALQVFVSLLLCLSTLFLFDQLLIRFNLGLGLSGLPVLFFALFAGFHPVFGFLTGASFAIFFIPLSLWALLANFSERKGQFSAFGFGFILSLSVLFCSPLIILFAFSFVALSVMKAPSWREYAALTLGLGMPPGLTYWIFFLADYHPYALPLPGYTHLWAFFSGISVKWSLWAALGLVFVLMNAALLHALQRINTFKIITRRFFSVLVVLPAFLIVGFPLASQATADIFLPVVFVFTVLLSRFVSDIQNPDLLRLLALMLIFALLLSRFDYYFAGSFTFKWVN